MRLCAKGEFTIIVRILDNVRRGQASVSYIVYTRCRMRQRHRIFVPIMGEKFQNLDFGEHELTYDFTTSEISGI